MNLVRYDAAKAALAECDQLDDVKDWADKGKAAEAYFRQARDKEMMRRAYRIKVRAKRRFGELTRAMETAPPGPAPEISSPGELISPPKPKGDVLADMGAAKKFVYEAEKLAEMAEDLFEEAIEQYEPPTEKDLMRMVNRPAKPAVRPPTAPPAGRYSVLLADPPWRYEAGPTPPGDAVENHYPTMPTADICALPVPALAAEDAALFLWATSPKLAEAVDVLRAWGFELRSSAVWVKPSIGPGYWFRQRHELLLVGVRGKFRPPANKQRRDSVFEAPRAKHSEKPAAVQAWIEQAFPGESKIELFARKPRDGWAVWGNEVEG